MKCFRHQKTNTEIFPHIISLFTSDGVWCPIVISCCSSWQQLTFYIWSCGSGEPYVDTETSLASCSPGMYVKYVIGSCRVCYLNTRTLIGCWFRFLPCWDITSHHPVFIRLFVCHIHVLYHNS